MSRSITTSPAFVDVAPHAMMQLLPQLSDEMLDRSIERLEANLTRPGAEEALQFALEERARRTPAHSSMPASAAPPAAATTFAAPARGALAVEQGPSEKDPAELAETAQRLIFQ